MVECVLWLSVFYSCVCFMVACVLWLSVFYG